MQLEPSNYKIPKSLSHFLWLRFILYIFAHPSKDSGLTHIVTDDNNKSPEFIKDVFFHPEKYPYLRLVFDYQKNGFTSYHVKIYEINYEKFVHNT